MSMDNLSWLNLQWNQNYSESKISDFMLEVTCFVNQFFSDEGQGNHSTKLKLLHVISLKYSVTSYP